MIFIDSDVFVIDLRYRRDPLFGDNQEFLRRVAERGDGATTLINLLEVAGVLSFNLGTRQLRELLAHFETRFGVTVLPDMGSSTELTGVTLPRVLDALSRRCSLGDALVLCQLEAVASAESAFVSWNARHFVGRTELDVKTPAAFVHEE